MITSFARVLRHDLLPQQGPAQTLDQVQIRIDLIGPVDGYVRERALGQRGRQGCPGAGADLRLARCRDAANIAHAPLLDCRRQCLKEIIGR